MRFSIGVFGIILDANNRVLLCHRRDRDVWNLPGGGLESGETPWEGVAREVEEEVGLRVAVARMVGVYSKPDKDEVVFSFICEPVGGEPSTSEEADEVRYFAFGDLPLNTLPKHIERIQDALDARDVTLLRVQISK